MIYLLRYIKTYFISSDLIAHKLKLRRISPPLPPKKEHNNYFTVDILWANNYYFLIKVKVNFKKNGSVKFNFSVIILIHF